MKKILIIDGHPNKDSLNFALAESYMKGAKSGSAETRKIRIADIKFNPNLEYGYQKRTELESDLLDAFELIKWADHLVWVYPVWWGGFPALMKGFIDRLFLPGFTYQPIENSLQWTKLLKGKTARIITTLDQPSWYYKLMYGSPSTNQLKRSILEFCGVNPVKVTYVGIVKSSDTKKREQWLAQIEKLGEKLK
jgi:NAD(P)H dehydrogenase (quinone)